MISVIGEKTMTNEKYRVESKGNVHHSGKKTSFKLFKRNGHEFIFAGCFFASGWDLTDEQCISDALYQLDDGQYPS